METAENFEILLDNIKRYRDELRVQIHLGGAEARDQWEELEKKWAELSRKVGAVRNTADDSAGEVGTAVGLLADELKEGYAAIRAQLR